jgi:hypothetical protein
MKVKDILPKLKANKNTYYNLSNKDIIIFKDLYNYLKKHKEKNIGGLLIDNQIQTINNTYNTNYLKKYKAMELIAYNIKN